MRVLPIGAGTVRQAPFPDGPAAEVLVDEQVGGGQLAAAHVTIPPGGAMPDHAYGESTALVVPLTGELLIASGQHQEQVTQGVVVLLDHGERVRLANETNAPVTLLAVFAPAGFVRALSSWPAMTTTAASTGTSGLGGDRAAWAEVHRQVVEQATHAPSVHNTSARLPGSRQRLGAALGLVGTPQLALRLGYAPGAPAPGAATTSRRAVAEVLSGHGQDSAGD